MFTWTLKPPNQSRFVRSSNDPAQTAFQARTMAADLDIRPNFRFRRSRCVRTFDRMRRATPARKGLTDMDALDRRSQGFAAA
ncbi:MAG: hypothetical protein KGJ32_12445 [Xanthomonadaceae bacterium]|nr:hypothetical protein [Xanthomonadaceae bacterium]